MTYKYIQSLRKLLACTQISNEIINERKRNYFYLNLCYKITPRTEDLV